MKNKTVIKKIITLQIFVLVLLTIFLAIASFYLPQQLTPTIYYGNGEYIDIKRDKTRMFPGISLISSDGMFTWPLMFPTELHYSYNVNIEPSPNGRKFIMAYQRSFAVVDAGTGRIDWYLKTENANYADDPKWSPNGELIGYELGDGMQSFVMVVKADGKGAKKVLEEQANFWGWTVDGRIIVSVVMGKEYFINLEDGRKEYFDTWVLLENSPTGDYVVKVDRKEDIVTLLNSKKPNTVVNISEKIKNEYKIIPLFVTWSPTGDWFTLGTHWITDIREHPPHLYLFKNDGTVYYDLTNEIFFPPPSGLWTSLIEWSPDGKMIAISGGDVYKNFMINDNVYIYHVDKRVVYTLPVGGRVGRVGWWPMIKSNDLMLPREFLKLFVYNKTLLMVLQFVVLFHLLATTIIYKKGDTDAQEQA